MTALYLPNSLNLPHVDIYKWARDKKIFLPYDFRKTPEEEYRNLRLLALKQFYIKATPQQEQERWAAALKETAQYIPSPGLSETTAFIINVGCHVIFCIFITVIPRLAKL